MRRCVLVVFAAMLALTSVSCRSDGDSAGETTTSAAVPDVVTSDDPIAQKIVDVATAKLNELDLTSAVFGVWRGDEEIVTGALGQSPIGVPATRDMVARVGQPMEPMLSTVLLQLDEAGEIDIDEPIAKWVPNFPRSDKITPRMLANSTTGISDYVTDPEFLKRFNDNPISTFTAEEIFAWANARPPLFEPGTSWAYAHSDLCLLGVVLEKATGKPLGDLLQTRIFDPLGMESAQVVLDAQLSGPYLHGYTSDRGYFEDSTFWNPTAFLNSGNMNATVADIGRWVRALGTGEVVSEKVFDEMMAPSTAGLGPLTTDKFFAFGTAHFGRWLFMNPSYGGYYGVGLYDAQTETTIIVYVTHGPTATGNGAITIGNAIGELMVPDAPPNAPV